MVNIKKPYFSNLDAIRFIAFVFVFFQHAFYNSFQSFEKISPTIASIINVIFLSGGLGVQIFFVLSGFLITYLILSEINSCGELSLKKFYIRRSLRIWPLYYATVIFGFIIYPYLKNLMGLGTELCSRPIYYFTFLANFDVIHIAQTCAGKDAMMQGILWSVSIEEQFYLIWPLLFFVFPKNKYWVIFPIVLISSFLFRFFNSGPTLYFHTFSVMGDLAMGGLFAYLIISSNKIYNSIANLSVRFINISYIIILGVFVTRNFLFQFSYGDPIMRIVLDGMLAYFIITQSFSINRGVNLGRFSFLTNCGKLSYGLYMLHPIGLLVSDILFRKLRIDISIFKYGILQGIVGLIITSMIVILSYRYLESPFLKIKERFSVIK